ncbi:MAG: hypothetical protein ACKO5Q_15250, partial [Microcystaceae cyanobacterium]
MRLLSLLFLSINLLALTACGGNPGENSNTANTPPVETTPSEIQSPETPDEKAENDEKAEKPEEES